MNIPWTSHLPSLTAPELETGHFYWLAILEESSVNDTFVGKTDVANRPSMQFFREEKSRGKGWDLILLLERETLASLEPPFPYTVCQGDPPSLQNTTTAHLGGWLQLACFQVGAEADPKLLCPWRAFPAFCHVSRTWHALDAASSCFSSAFRIFVRMDLR